MIKAAVEMLMKETSGEDVILFLKTRCKKLSSLNSTMSLVRTTLMKNDENRSPDCDYRELSTFQEPGVKEFIGSSLIDQNNIQRSHKTNPIWGPGAEIALHKIKLLPTGMEHFYLSRADSIALKRQQEANQKKKNESVIIIEESEKLVERLSDILRTSTFEHSISHLALALLLCSGRRFVEIMNRKSTFEAVEGSEYHCKFTGQAKKRGQGIPYVIPLICKFKYFHRALCFLRQKQPTDITSFPNARVSRMYQQMLKRHMDNGVRIPFMPRCKLHDHRAACCSLVFVLFDCPNTFARTVCEIIGHESIQESLSYNHVRLKGVGQMDNSLGSLSPPEDRESALALLELGEQ